MEGRHEIGVNFDPNELSRIVKKVGGEEPADDAGASSERFDRREETPVQFHENLGERIRVDDQNAAMVEGIVEGFESKGIKPPKFKSETAPVTPDNAVEYAIKLINYRISTKLEQTSSVRNAKELEAIVNEAEAKTLVKTEIAKGNNEATMKFLKGEYALAVNKLGSLEEAAAKSGFKPEKRIRTENAAQAKLINEVKYYAKRKLDIQKSLQALGAKIMN
jgi:hypothetical protein